MLAAKAKYLVVAGGAFPSGPAEAHIRGDLPAFQLKGTGWYVTDYAKGGAKPASVALISRPRISWPAALI